MLFEWIEKKNESTTKKIYKNEFTIAVEHAKLCHASKHTKKMRENSSF